MTLPAITLTIEDSIANLTFTRGDIGNPVNGEFCDALYDAAITLSERTDVRVVVLRAEGRAFSYGGDIASFLPQLDALPRIMKQWTGNFHTGIIRLLRIDAPIIASVHDVCAGGMVALVAGADFVIGCEHTKFVAAYAGIGLACDGGASVSLVDRLGRAGARRFLLLNQTLDAKAAEAAGLLDEHVAADALEDRTVALAQQLASGPTVAFGEIRRLLRTSGTVPIEAQLEAEAQAMARAAATADAREGISAFAAKRRPVFIGK